MKSTPGKSTRMKSTQAKPHKPRPVVWTSHRKWMGNLVPALFWLPLALTGIVIVARTGDYAGAGLWFLVSATLVGWGSMNQFGLFANQHMKKQLSRILAAQGKDLPKDSWFVGFATPKYSSTLDPHEDVGFLFVLPDRLKFVSETRLVEVMMSDIREVRFRPNVHSVLLAGRWISIEGEVAGKAVRLLVELREHRTLLRNFRASGDVLATLEAWRKKSSPES